MKPRVYIETSIPSFFYDERKSHEAISRRNWTRSWWNNSTEFEKLSSIAVIGELSFIPNLNKREHCLSLIHKIPLLFLEPEIEHIVSSYINNRIMPEDTGGDALHLALASFYKCDYLLTWNCKHLANANKFDQIRWLNNILGLYVPKIVTPLELMGNIYDT